jgi:DNA primase
MLIVAQYSESDPGLFDSDHAQIESTLAPEIKPEFRVISPRGATAKFWGYLEARGFKQPEALIFQFSLQCSLTGRFKDRLIIPLYREGSMVAWTGRALGEPKIAPRYLSSRLVKTTILNEDVLFTVGAGTLFVVEGPFDAMKLDHYGWTYGARATCTFGTTISTDQLVLIKRLAKRFSRVVVLFDQDAVEQAYAALDWLQAPNVSLGQLPSGVKDPGAMSSTDIERFIKRMRS